MDPAHAQAGHGAVSRSLGERLALLARTFLPELLAKRPWSRISFQSQLLVYFSPF